MKQENSEIGEKVLTDGLDLCHVVECVDEQSELGSKVYQTTLK